MAFDIIIKGGHIATATETYKGDIAIKDGKIAAIGTDLDASGAKVVDAKGTTIMPGGIDVHTHLDMPFMGATTADDFVTGPTAAAIGGTTSIIDFAIQKKGEALRSAFDTWQGKASGKSAIDYAFHMICV